MRVRIAAAAFILFGWIGGAAAQVSPNSIVRVAGPFGGDARRPLVNITASLVSRDGSVAWKKTDFVTNLSKLTEAYTYDQLAQDPLLTIKSFEQASVLVSRQIFADLKK